MTLESLGNIGEFLGALAVLVSLFYLGFQIRQNTRAARAATHQAWATTNAAVNMLLPQSLEFTRVYRTGSVDPAKLDPEELTQFNAYMLQAFNGFEGLYFQFRNGAIDSIYWHSKVEQMRVLMGPPGIRSWWERYSEIFFDPRFREVVHREALKEPAA